MPETLAPWAERHANWRWQGNTCKECERLERSVDRKVPARTWVDRLDTLIGAKRWDGVQPTVLLGRASEPTLSTELRPREPEPLDGPVGSELSAPDAHVRAPQLTLAQLKRKAENLEVKIAGLKSRGPTQSRVAWERSIEDAEAELTRTWTLWRDKLDEEAVQA